MDLKIRNVAVKDIMPVVSILRLLDYKAIVAEIDAVKIATRLKSANMTTEEREAVSASDEAMMGIVVEMALPVISVVLDKLPECCVPLFHWLASMCDMTDAEFSALPPAAVPEALYEIIHQEGFSDFFGAVRRFLR